MSLLLLLVMIVTQNIFFDKALALKLEEDESPSFLWYFVNSIINMLIVLTAVEALNLVKI